MAKFLKIWSVNYTKTEQLDFFRIGCDNYNLCYTVPQVEVVSMSVSCFTVLLYVDFLILQAKHGYF